MVIYKMDLIINNEGTTVTRENIDRKLDFYASILTLLISIKKKFDEDDKMDISQDSDIESLMSISDDEE